MDEVNGKKCSRCAKSIIVDDGLSNWMVEESVVHCSLGLNPECPFDRWYGEDEKDLFAETCPAFISGVPVEIDVDRELSEYGKTGPEYWAPYQTEHVSAADIERVMNDD